MPPATQYKYVEATSPFPERAKRLLDALYDVHSERSEGSLDDGRKIEILEGKLGGHFGFDACGGDLSDSLRRTLLEEEYLASEKAIDSVTV